MTGSSGPEVECEQQHASLQVSDVAAAVEFYTMKLGFRPASRGAIRRDSRGQPGSVQMFLRRGTPSPQGCSVHFVIGNADQLYEFQRANGVEAFMHQETGTTGCAITASAI